MPISRVSAFCRYWAEHPPTHELVAAYMNVRARPSRVRQTTIEEVRAAKADFESVYEDAIARDVEKWKKVVKAANIKVSS